MFQTDSLFNSLFLQKINKPIISHISTQELYFLYLIFKRNGLKLDFFQFYSFLFLIKKNLTSFYSYKFFTFLFLFFFFKTNLVKSFFFSTLPKLSYLNTLNTYTTNLVNFQKLDIFWKKFKKLKRPTTENDFNSFFLKYWENKINIYKTLGFFKTINIFYSIGFKLNNSPQVVVHINKQLITSPKLSSTSIVKYLNVNQCNDFEFQFLRKNKVYNKGRYSRCRQNYRTGVYMCMYLSVCSIFGLYYWFYKFTFNFSYLWWFFIFFFGSFFLPKIVKYRFYEPITLLNKFFDFFKWICSLVRSILF